MNLGRKIGRFLRQKNFVFFFRAVVFSKRKLHVINAINLTETDRFFEVKRQGIKLFLAFFRVPSDRDSYSKKLTGNLFQV